MLITLFPVNLAVSEVVKQKRRYAYISEHLQYIQQSCVLPHTPEGYRCLRFMITIKRSLPQL